VPGKAVPPTRNGKRSGEPRCVAGGERSRTPDATTGRVTVQQSAVRRSNERRSPAPSSGADSTVHSRGRRGMPCAASVLRQTRQTAPRYSGKAPPASQPRKWRREGTKYREMLWQRRFGPRSPSTSDVLPVVCRAMVGGDSRRAKGVGVVAACDVTVAAEERGRCGAAGRSSRSGWLLLPPVTGPPKPREMLRYQDAKIRPAPRENVRTSAAARAPELPVSIRC